MPIVDQGDENKGQLFKSFRDDKEKLIFMAQQISELSSNSNIVISDTAFDSLYEKFVNRFNFNSFYCGKVDEEEGYKRKICIDALKALHSDEWKESDIGTGKIINFVKQAVDIKDNNLVRWNIKKPDSDTAKNSLNNKIFLNPDKSKGFEKVIFQLYTNKIDDGMAFDIIRDLAGFYNYVAYLFFIKDPVKYLPISPENFDNIFKKFGLDFKTDMKCSWSNYQQYLDIIGQVQVKLQDKGIDLVTLLDAHTFCWMLKEIENIDEKKFCSSLLTPSKIYSRKELMDLFSITDSSINNGVYPVAGFSTIMLFFTENRDSGSNTYHDYFDGEILYFDGQTKGEKDKDIMNHAKGTKEIIVFYQKNKKQYPDYEFKYLGKFEYISHSGSNPTKFQLGAICTLPNCGQLSSFEYPEINDLEPARGAEGRQFKIFVNKIERNPRLRKKALQYHGATCKACGIDYSTIYGDMKERIIEVHHIIPLHHHKGEVEINPYVDLIPLCANCHTLIHKVSDGSMPIDEFKKLLADFELHQK